MGMVVKLNECARCSVWCSEVKKVKKVEKRERERKAVIVRIKWQWCCGGDGDSTSGCCLLTRKKGEIVAITFCGC